MTTLAVLTNDQGFAVAADSFVGSAQRGLLSADKLFTFGDCRPVVAAAYGSSRVLGMPLVGALSRIVATAQPREHLIDYARAAPGELAKLTARYSIDIDDDGALLDRAAEQMRGWLNQHGGSEEIKACSDWIKPQVITLSPVGPEDDEGLRHEAVERVIDAREAELAQRLTHAGLPDDHIHLSALAAFALSWRCQPPRSGLVWVGLGTEEVRPQIAHTVIGGALAGEPVWTLRIESAPPGQAAIRAYAQPDIVRMLHWGVHPDVYRAAIEGFDAVLSQVVTDPKFDSEARADAAKTFREALDSVIAKQHMTPLQSATERAMPRELASMATMLVRMTAFKRRVDQPLPTVGDPVNVAWAPCGGPVATAERSRTLDV
jgi:hypothetical protein